jgi:hypothetical protein
VLGNHDYGSKPLAQVERTALYPNGYWQMPGTNYTKIYDIPGGGTVQIVFIDTTTLAPSENKYTNENGGISKSTQSARISNQLAAVKGILDATVSKPPTWLLVAGKQNNHH